MKTKRKGKTDYFSTLKMKTALSIFKLMVLQAGGVLVRQGYACSLLIACRDNAISYSKAFGILTLENVYKVMTGRKTCAL